MGTLGILVKRAIRDSREDKVLVEIKEKGEIMARKGNVASQDLGVSEALVEDEVQKGYQGQRVTLGSLVPQDCKENLAHLASKALVASQDLQGNLVSMGRTEFLVHTENVDQLVTRDHLGHQGHRVL